ncbi:MAG: fluoride efflux transporter CrcB [Xanthobacteraceae bacterium]
MNLQLIAAVALGGAVGSVARYLAGIGAGRIFGTDFPWGTLLINIAGSFLIGVFVESFALRWDLPQAARVFLTVGVCGGFTTFSTFSLESFLLIERGQFGPAAAYIVASVALSIVALFGGLHLVRALA